MLLAIIIMGGVGATGLIVSFVMYLTDKECRAAKPAPSPYSRYWQTIYATAMKADAKSPSR